LMFTAAKAMLDITSTTSASKRRFIWSPLVVDGHYTPLLDEIERRGINAPRMLRVDLAMGKDIAGDRREGRTTAPRHRETGPRW
jgi:hypothetical protein